MNESYRSAGVDITAGYKAVELIKAHAAKTLTPGVLTDLGGFGGLYEPDIAGMEHPVLVSGTDGVGTKLKLAFILEKHDTVGIDCVAMCVNDVICSGAKPLFFLDYIAAGKNYPEKTAAIVSGIAEGCIQSGCALIGGETAEHPGLMPDDEYDLAGFCVGIADKDRLLKSDSQKPGDVLIALKSSGLRSNGFSLVRKIFKMNRHSLEMDCDELGGTIGECLLTPTRIYVKPILELLGKVNVKAITHITGGGFYENIPRQLPEGITAAIDSAALQIPQIFTLIARLGNVSQKDMFNTFNMGVGMTVSVSKNDADKTLAILNNAGVQAYIMGELRRGNEGVVLK
jgi:phosphoribosylformylglycinamidine cyclo-ligase